MGSCVSHCSRQDVVHQQTGRVIADVQKSFEVTTGSALLQKSLAGIGSETKVPESSEVRDQINAEIRALREQLVRSQVLFTYLLKNTSENAKSPDGKKELCTLFEGGTLSDAMFQCKSFDGQVLTRLYNRSNRSSSSYTSHRSTPMHCGYTSLSCPTLPIDYPVVTKSTQTEPLSDVSFFIDHTDTSRVLSAESTHSINKGLFSPPITPCGTIPETFLLSDVCEIHREPEDHSYPRHRTNSFLSAVKEGNPKLIDAEFENEAEKKQTHNGMCEMVKKNEMVHLSDHQSSISDVSSSFSSIAKISEEGRSISDEVKECVFPRKLSILLEEDYEDASGNFFSVCSSQPVLNKKRKVSQLCTAKTQTDLSIYVNPSALSHKKPDLPVTETCFPRCGFEIVSHTVQTKTIFSEELPKRLVLRHPPPYTKKRARNRTNATFADNCFQDQHSKPKTQICKWFTVCESVPSRSESSQNLTPSSQNNRLQTRHLSLEKQESFSSCDHSLYPDSRMSSVTDCSGWITKSDVELNLRPEPPSYQQSILSSQRCQFTRNSTLETISSDSKLSNEKGYTASGTNILERAKFDNDIKLIEDRNGNNKEKNFKYSQRSMRRGSGAGSPNSQLSIPRYPAFDFSEQEDVHSMFPSPSEPEANRNIKTFQEVPKLEMTADPDAAQNTMHLTDTSHKKRNSSKSKTLMPEHMENSETESTKGSFECEVPDLPPSADATSIPVPDIAFPSLPNTFLAKLGVHKDSPLPVEAFDEHDLESKFIALSLAFKTDRATLNKRLELHKRQRDMAEKNVENEFQSIRDHLCALNLKTTSSDVRDLISKIQNHLDIAQQATSRVSGRSETYGAVQQEERVSRAFEVLVLHVDHLKRLFDKEHKELEDTRRMLTDTRVFRKEVAPDVVSEDQKKYSKTFGLPVGSIKSVGRRRASVSDFHPRSFLENCKSPGFSQSWTSGVSLRKVKNEEKKLFVEILNRASTDLESPKRILFLRDGFFWAK
ncbi:lymphoid-restricted membrane protein [Nephila pilipes]|uniref:Lymphoid-restricted membrane protein n=1 Tax=Nephila pilipes TaxID=299642 RepID=A0A8X6PFG1_NEPPI|nr:lymphoid-restricted membrane protein [Nephila pilipes]